MDEPSVPSVLAGIAILIVMFLLGRMIFNDFINSKAIKEMQADNNKKESKRPEEN